MTLSEILKLAADAGASDVLLIAGLPASYKAQGHIVRTDTPRLTPVDTEALAAEAYKLAQGRSMERLRATGDDDFSFSLAGLARFRVNALRQRGSLGLIIRIVSFVLPDPAEMGIPDKVMELCTYTKGLVLITGAAGSGKSTTLACMVDRINSTRNCHIITIEDPIEFLHSHKMSVVTQRELQLDTVSYAVALRAALREAPDVILLGEMRDAETIHAAVTAAETGHLVLSTLHTVGAANTIDRIIDVFPPAQQQQIRTQLSMVLEGVVSQQLVPAADGTLAPAFEVMLANSAVRNMIRESKAHQLDNVITSSAAEGMVSMDQSLLALAQAGRITPEDALRQAVNCEWLQKRLS